MSTGKDWKKTYNHYFPEFSLYSFVINFLIMRRNQILILLWTLGVFGLSFGQNDRHSGYKTAFVEVNGIQTHFLDFSGEGLPVILVHSEAWDATTYKDFGPLLTAHNRVLAVTRPGYGESGMGDYAVESQGDHLIAFANALGIDKAVFIGNSSVTKELTYLAENYPQRTAGVVYLSGPATPWLDLKESDPYRASEMFGRVSPVSNSEKNDREAIGKARAAYRPHHYSSDSINIDVPALIFTARNGGEGHEKGVAALVFAGSPLMEEVRKDFPPSALRTHLDRMANDSLYRNQRLNAIVDEEAREYFLKLAGDTVFQRKVYQFHMQTIYPATISAQKKLKKAYGKNLQLVKLEVPQIIGYEYRDTPELIIEPIKDFLEQIGSE